MATILNQKLMNSGLLDNLRLNQKKYSNIKESKRLVSIYEQHIFIWNDTASCILTSEINSAETKDGSCVKLTLSNPPVFDVESILFNHIGSLIALSGRNGVTIFEVPWRYGKFTSSSGDRETIMGRSWNVAEYFFVCSNRISIVQIAWHPGSQSNTHLTVLSSDNYIRIYDVTEPQRPQQVIALGASAKSSFLSSESKISFSTCFGENSVSFDFGPPEIMQAPEQSSPRITKSFEEVTIWPIYLLNGNGDVFVIKTPLRKDRAKPVTKVMGPLTMYPPSEDNYGYDACYILCLHTVPTCIVVATATGIIYHCIVLENSSKAVKDNQFHSSWDLGSSPDECDTSLYVFESVELPLSLTEDQDDVYSHPIRLYKDITSQSKYHCTHVSGLHSVAVPFLQAIEECLETEGIEKLLMDRQKQSCIVEHILCTKPFAQMDSVPVLGLDVAISDAGITMICLLASWEFICLPLVSSYFSNVPQLLSEEDALTRECDKSSIPMFEQQIEKTLHRSVCCPYLKSSSLVEHSNTNPQQWLDLLCNVTQRFREDYVQRLNTAQALLRSRIKVLIQQKEYQLRDISKTQQEKETLKIGAERLAEKYEDANTNQQKLLKRLESVLKKFQQNLPYLSKSELNMKETLLSYGEKLKVFESSLEQIKKKLKHQNDKMKGDGNQISASTTELSNLNLTETQVKHVKELLIQEGESISELMKTVSTMKKQIGL